MFLSNLNPSAWCPNDFPTLLPKQKKHRNIYNKENKIKITWHNFTITSRRKVKKESGYKYSWFKFLHSRQTDGFDAFSNITSLNKIYSKNIRGGAKVMFEPLWRLKRGFLSLKLWCSWGLCLPGQSTGAQPSSREGAAVSGLAQNPGSPELCQAGFPWGRCTKGTKCCVHEPVGASALSAFSPDTQHIYGHRISLLSKLKLLKQTNANVILAVTRFLDMGHNKDWFSHRTQIETFTDFLSRNAVFNLALLGELDMRVLQVITFWRIILNHIPDHNQIDGIPSLLLQN